MSTKRPPSTTKPTAQNWTIVDLRLKVVELRIAAYRQATEVGKLMREAADALEQCVDLLTLEKVSEPTALRGLQPDLVVDRPNLPRGFPADDEIVTRLPDNLMGGPA